MPNLSQKCAMLLVTALLALLTACARQPARPAVLVVPQTDDNQIAMTLDYVGRVLSLPPASQIIARDDLAQQFKLMQFPEDRMRLALLDTLLPAPTNNHSEAIALLTGYNWEAVGPGFKGLAMAVLEVLDTEQTNANSSALLTQQLAAERAQKNHLQQQLDALKSIEKTMNTRDKPVLAPSASTKPSLPNLFPGRSNTDGG